MPVPFMMYSSDPYALLKFSSPDTDLYLGFYYMEKKCSPSYTSLVKQFNKFSYPDMAHYAAFPLKKYKKYIPCGISCACHLRGQLKTLDKTNMLQGIWKTLQDDYIYFNLV